MKNKYYTKWNIWFNVFEIVAVNGSDVRRAALVTSHLQIFSSTGEKAVTILLELSD